MLIYDIEAFKHYWCVVVVDDVEEMRYVFEDVESLRSYYKKNRHQTWVGYNSRQYDQAMLRFIMLGLDPYECSQALIVLKKKWWQFPMNVKEAYTRIPLRNFDCMVFGKGLKKLEGFRGSNIIECSIPWDYPDPLTREQKDEVVHYCTHDVLECRKVLYDTFQEYEAHEGLVKTFGLNDIHFSKTQAQLSALILGAEKRKWFDEWEYEIAPTAIVERYTHIVDFYNNPENHDYGKELKTVIAGVPHTFGWGGVHGAMQYSGEGIYINMDVRSYYPSLMIEYGYLSRNVKDPKKFEQIYWDRIEFKKVKDPRQEPYKRVLNGTYGASKDQFNALYDPRQANSVCVSGQILLVDLMEKLEDHCDIIQSNTDGVMVKLRDSADEDKIKAIGQEWSDRTKMVLEYDVINKVFQKDVNNYITVDAKGKVKAKGAHAKPWLKEKKQDDGTKTLVYDLVDFDCVILREALHEYLIKGIAPEETINNCKELIKFQKIGMISDKYTFGFQGNLKDGIKKSSNLSDYEYTKINEKYLRIFASTNTTDGGIFKVHAITGKVAKMASTPVNAFMVNDDITGLTTDEYPLDRKFYIDEVYKRAKKFMSKVG